MIHYATDFLEIPAESSGILFITESYLLSLLFSAFFWYHLSL